MDATQGTNEERDTGELAEGYDVVVVGGGAAGLSGALSLGRARRRVLVVDAGQPRNAPAEGVHVFLTRDGISPQELVAIGRDEVRRYGGRVTHGTVVALDRVEGGFAVELADGRRTRAKKLLVTTGLVDVLPDIPGLRELWGTDVIHCPYCHGWEVQDEPIGVLGQNAMAVHQALMFRQWSDDIVLFRHRAPALTDEQAEQLAARGIRVVDDEVVALERDGSGRLAGVRVATGEVVPRVAVATASRLEARGEVLGLLGLEVTPHPLGADLATMVPSDAMGKTAVDGVWVAGNVTDPMAQVITSAAAAMMAGAAINADLMAEELAAAVSAARAG
ncbi:NAD(P)/FAD-dependent oxidoreductase [Aquihabitans sp. G128]|uniref:NAD(P)/FAD-dependent oxidoreductase n=1 Tax=Aquihabitans sp. G128 TaxID=2849779 RepID=UPI001C23C76D|nr:NAD(P)/FAD-dependent oxidoreductase [Aquihabitans sp. G128]QXC60705.1 NAD(P)/FAD-dependent oxidoreductase [Aquihabitans sp. G128]